jgi:hypothetical protein
MFDLDNHINFVEDQSEWKGTRITFEVLGNRIPLQPPGLGAGIECFDVCSNARGFFINSSSQPDCYG